MRADNRPKAIFDNHSRTYAECQAVRLYRGLCANRREEPRAGRLLAQCPPPCAMRLWWHL